MDFLTSPYFLLFARLCVGGVFVVSGIGKWLDKPGTEASMSKYLFLPRGSGRFIANVFPFLELLIGLALIFGLLTRVASAGAFLLFVLFTGLIVYDLSRGKNQSCHCFGKLSDDKLTPMAVVRNLFLMALSLLVLFAFDGWLSLDWLVRSSTTVFAEGSWGWLIAPTGNSSGAAPDPATAIPLVLLSLFTVAVVVFGGQAVSMVRNTLRGLGFR
ncbi:MAG: MauE/DoxX family redox-associated membrane protein [Chloroflexota bacterium]